MLKQKGFFRKDIENSQKAKKQRKDRTKFCKWNILLSKFGPKIQNCYSYPIIAREIAHNGKSSISIFQEITKKDWALGNNSIKFWDFPDIF